MLTFCIQASFLLQLRVVIPDRWDGIHANAEWQCPAVWHLSEHSMHKVKVWLTPQVICTFWQLTRAHAAGTFIRDVIFEFHPPHRYKNIFKVKMMTFQGVLQWFIFVTIGEAVGVPFITTHKRMENCYASVCACTFVSEYSYASKCFIFA